MRTIRVPFVIAALLAFALSVSVGDTAANGVPTTKTDDNSVAITANDLKPAACASLNLTTVITGSGTINGTAGNDLITGSAGNDNISGNGGNDCILGGNGKDTLNGGTGTDVCIAGPSSTPTYKGCETQL